MIRISRAVALILFLSLQMYLIPPAVAIPGEDQDFSENYPFSLSYSVAPNTANVQQTAILLFPSNHTSLWTVNKSTIAFLGSNTTITMSYGQGFPGDTSIATVKKQSPTDLHFRL